jgi:hypothetical protein
MEDGALRATVKQLEAWNALLTHPSSTARRRVYIFNPSWKGDLRAAQRRQRPLDLLEGQRVVLVRGNWTRDRDLRTVAWVIELGRAERSLLALVDGSTHAAANRLAKGLAATRGTDAELLEVIRRWLPEAR